MRYHKSWEKKVPELGSSDVIERSLFTHYSRWYMFGMIEKAPFSCYPRLIQVSDVRLIT